MVGWAVGRRWAWSGLALLVLAADYATGPRIHFPILYLLPVALAARGPLGRLAPAVAVAMPLARFGFSSAWSGPWRPREEAANAAHVAAVLVAFAHLLRVNAAQTRALEQEVRVLEGLLPICSFCKKIRDAEGAWQPLERYIGERSEARFSHGVCPECAREHYGVYLRGEEGGDPGYAR